MPCIVAMFVQVETASAVITEAMLSTSCLAAVACSNSGHDSSASSISISIMPALERLLCCCAGHLTQGISLYSDLLAELQPGVCSGLYAELLVKKADAQRQQGQFSAALQDLDCAMAWEPESADCLRLRALVYRESGNYTQSFMEFQKLGKLMPDNAEVFEELQQAAQLCLDSRQQALRAMGTEQATLGTLHWD
ncbi:TPA: hypothetical protein ACH3X1_009418 [Trebouxia sp. C0004]